jgi:molybdopterin molybdotransferase
MSGINSKLLSVEEAVRLVIEKSPPREPLESLLGGNGCKLLGQDVQADRDHPPFDKALLDGFAVRAADLVSGSAELLVVEEVTAGRVPSRTVEPGHAIAIMTGAPMPQGADAVVMVEHSSRIGERVRLTPLQPPVPGEGWMPRGREMKKGEIVARRGDPLTPARVGLLASVGCVRPLVSPFFTLTIVSTGNELVDIEQDPGPGQIRNSNAHMLCALAQCDDTFITEGPIVPDERKALTKVLAGCMGKDIVLITGGVSAGKMDLVPGVLEALRVEPVFHKVSLKPGKPLFFGVGPIGNNTRPRALVFALPGNPVSALVGYLLFVRTAIRAMAGESVTGPRYRHGGMLANSNRHRGDRPTYHPARWIEPDPGTAAPPKIELLPWAGSPDLRAVASADGFAVIPAGDREDPPGTPLAFLPIEWREPRMKYMESRPDLDALEEEAS